MQRTLVMLMILSACGRPAAVPAPVPPPTVQALAGGCYRLVRSDGIRSQSPMPFWSGLVRLDSVRSTRFGTLPRPDTVAGDPRHIVTLAAPSEALTGDTLRFSSHWEISAGRLRLTRTTGFTSEITTLSPSPDGFVGERALTSDVVVPGAPRRVHPVRFIREPCPAGSRS